MKALLFDLYIWYLLLINICRVSLFQFLKRSWGMFFKIGVFLELSNIVRDNSKSGLNLWQIHCEREEFLFSEVPSFQASILRKIDVYFFFQECSLLFKNTYFKERIVMTPSMVSYTSSNYSLCVHWFILCMIDFVEAEFL